jgi:type II secretory pathway pseudopilin PulG
MNDMSFAHTSPTFDGPYALGTSTNSAPPNRRGQRGADSVERVVNKTHHPSPITHHLHLSGFTSIELIIVILVLVVLAGTAVVSFRLSDEDKSIIAADQLIADIQYVQMRAMGVGSQQNILFSTGTSSYSIREGANVIEQKSLPDDVIIRNANFNGSNILTFNTLGEPTFSSSINGTIDLGKGTSPNKTIAVLSITGKVQ